jgi:peptide/nickel transport system permease protein
MFWQRWLPIFLLQDWIRVSVPASDSAAVVRTAERGAVRRGLVDPLGRLGLICVLLIIIAAVFADVISTYDPIKMMPRDRFQSPSYEHLLGTDQLGRDLFSRVIHGGRVALMVAIPAIGISLGLGIFFGLLAGYAPKWLDNILLLFFDAIRSFPTVMLALALATIIGPSLYTVVLVVILFSAPAYARIIRTQTLALRSAEFVLASIVTGASIWRVLGVHILPNILGPILILVSMDLPVVITTEAGMSFLGLGVRPPTPSWGSILNDGYAFIRESPWMAIAGGLPIIIATIGFTFLGESLRDAYDPKLRQNG